MKFTIAAILALTPSVLGARGERRLSPAATPVGVIGQGEACEVTWTRGVGTNYDAHYEDYDPAGDGSGLCNSDLELECNFQIDITADIVLGTPIPGTCEPESCMGTNSLLPPGTKETSTHRVTICHRTCSETNPWVRITIDDDAWAGNTTCGHGIQHDIDMDCGDHIDKTKWGENDHDYLIRDHGNDGSGSRAYQLSINTWTDADENAYWRKWEKACPYVQNGNCCDDTKTGDDVECCGIDTPTEPAETTTVVPPATTPETTTVAPPVTTLVTTDAPPATTPTPTIPGGGGGDPHFQRWGQEHDSFHGECDLVMVHSENFHQGTGFDLQARTTIQDYFSYIETMAMKIGDYELEFHKDHFFLNDVQYTPADLPLTFGGDYKYTVENAVVEHGKNVNYYQYYKVDMHQQSSVLFKFYKKFLTFEINGHPNDFADAVGLMGEFHTGDMISRDGRMMQNFVEYGFEWQVSPEDSAIFRDARSPQLPYEKCRMPSNDRPARRKLRANNSALTKEAMEACAHVSGSGLDLCVDDVLQTGDVGLATLW